MSDVINHWKFDYSRDYYLDGRFCKQKESQEFLKIMFLNIVLVLVLFLFKILFIYF